MQGLLMEFIECIGMVYDVTEFLDGESSPVGLAQSDAYSQVRFQITLVCSVVLQLCSRTE